MPSIFPPLGVEADLSAPQVRHVLEKSLALYTHLPKQVVDRGALLCTQNNVARGKILDGTLRVAVQLFKPHSGQKCDEIIN